MSATPISQLKREALEWCEACGSPLWGGSCPTCNEANDECALCGNTNGHSLMCPSLGIATNVIEGHCIEKRIETKAVMIDGRWVTRPYVLTRGPNGLSDRPVNAKPQVKP